MHGLTSAPPVALVSAPNTMPSLITIPTIVVPVFQAVGKVEAPPPNCFVSCWFLLYKSKSKPPVVASSSIADWTKVFI